MTEEKQVDKPKVLSPDYVPKGEAEVKYEFKDVGEDNIRLKVAVNIPAGTAFFQITESDPPLLVVVVRADKDLVALGVLEKCKLLIHSFQARLKPQVDLSKGVRGALTGGLLKPH